MAKQSHKIIEDEHSGSEQDEASQQNSGSDREEPAPAPRTLSGRSSKALAKQQQIGERNNIATQ